MQCSRIKHIPIYFHGKLIVRASIVRATGLPRTIDGREKYMFYGMSVYIYIHIQSEYISRSQGTLAFTAPETLFEAYPIDVWEMGVTLYLMFPKLITYTYIPTDCSGLVRHNYIRYKYTKTYVTLHYIF